MNLKYYMKILGIVLVLGVLSYFSISFVLNYIFSVFPAEDFYP